jgi:hypothetical protein
MVDGIGMIVRSLPETVQSNLVTVWVPGIVEARATCAAVPEQMVSGEGVAGVTFGTGLVVTVALPEIVPDVQAPFASETRV